MTDISTSSESTSAGARLVTSLEREHELNKIAKELSIGLPIREDSARAIAARIGSNPLALAAFGSWIEALQEAIEDSVAGVGFGTEPGNPESIVVRTLSERLRELSRQAEEINSRLIKGNRPPERHLVGASQFEHTTNHDQELGAEKKKDRTDKQATKSELPI
jgi:hypothetical protein